MASHSKSHNLNSIEDHGESATQWTSLYSAASGLGTTGNLYLSSLQFDTTAEIEVTEGQLAWNETDGTLDLGMPNDVTQQIGQELFIKVYNDSGSAIANGSPVYFNGRQGTRPKIYLAKADSDATCCVEGLATQDIDDKHEGYITTFGYVRQIKTNYSGDGDWGTTWVAGDKLYVSKDVAGQLTNVEPESPHHSDVVGEVGIVGALGTGSIFIRIQRHQDLEELSDVNGTALTTNGQMVIWNQTSGFFDFDYNINDYVTTAANGSFENGITVGDGTTEVGIKIDTNDPSYGWRDITGVITWDYSGPDSPVVANFRDPVRVFYLDTNDNVDCSFHIPHDYVQGSDLFIHFHWSHDAATSITGPLSCVFSTTYSRRSNGTDYIFPEAKKHYITYETVDLATTPQYSHRVDEVQITSLTDTTTSYAASSIEVDGVILVDTLFAVIPTMVGQAGAPTTANRIPLLHVDLHYQSHNLGTKNKAFPFYL